MATVRIGETDYEIDLPFGLDVLEDAGDAIDEFTAKVGETLELQAGGKRVPTRLGAQMARAAVDALWIAIEAKTPGLISQAGLRASVVALEDAGALSAALTNALRRSGFKAKGEDGAGEPQGAKPPRSARKSAASSRASRSTGSAPATGTR